MASPAPEALSETLSYVPLLISRLSTKTNLILLLGRKKAAQGLHHVQRLDIGASLLHHFIKPIGSLHTTRYS